MKHCLILALNLVLFYVISFITSLAYADSGSAVCIMHDNKKPYHVEACVRKKCVKVYKVGKYLAVKPGDKVDAKFQAYDFRRHYENVGHFKVNGRGKNGVSVGESIVISHHMGAYVNKTDLCQ